MENDNYVDNLGKNKLMNCIFQHEKNNYTHLRKTHVDNVYNFNHIKKCLKFKGLRKKIKINSHCLHNVFSLYSVKE